MSKVLIIGSGDIATEAAKIFAQKNDVSVVSSEQAKKENILFEEGNPYIIHNTHPLLEVTHGKQFICHGKHQYRRVEYKENSSIKVEWICQCGRKTND